MFKQREILKNLKKSICSQRSLVQCHIRDSEANIVSSTAASLKMTLGHHSSHVKVNAVNCSLEGVVILLKHIGITHGVHFHYFTISIQHFGYLSYSFGHKQNIDNSDQWRIQGGPQGAMAPPKRLTKVFLHTYSITY